MDTLFPFTCTRPVSAIRLGILTIGEKWDRLLPGGKPQGLPDNIVPNRALAERIRQEQGTANHPGLTSYPDLSAAAINRRLPQAQHLQYPWQLFQLNDGAIRDDFELLTKGRKSAPIPPSVQVISPESIFIEEGASIHYSILNASTGPIYIGRKATIMEGSLIRGPFALCEGAVVKMGTKIYGATTIGPYSTAGGEIKNSILFGHSNKGHDGYLGDSVIGEWCNLGAGTSNSNLKNNAADVKVWSPGPFESGQFISAGLKCGLLMGDYSRAAINTSFNTGTVVGVCCNVFGEGLTPKYIPHFSWGFCHTEPQGPKYAFEKALRDIDNWKKLKNQSLTDAEIQTLKHIFEGKS
ncbi:MAG TPA: putative sugar nucleotidyl transferase [Puia sp.]|nr:putative sugar nucleotidyl transferase [Puia sp.]